MQVFTYIRYAILFFCIIGFLGDIVLAKEAGIALTAAKSLYVGFCVLNSYDLCHGLKNLSVIMPAINNGHSGRLVLLQYLLASFVIGAKGDDQGGYSIFFFNALKIIILLFS